MNLADILTVHRRAHPGKSALVCGPRRVTYGRLAVLVDDCAARLLQHGVRAGDVVALGLPDGIEYVIVLYGLAKMGAVACPLSGTSPDLERQRLLKQVRARWLLMAQGHSPLPSVSVVPTNAICDLKARIAPAPRQQVSTRNFAAGAPLVIISSSGTSAAAKFLLLSHAQMHWRITTREGHIGIAATDRYYSLINLSFNLGRIRCLRALQRGATVVFPGPRTRNIVTEMRRQRITTTNMMPIMARRLAERARGGKPLLGDIRLVIGSSPLSAEDKARLRERLTPHLFEVYATTETGPVAVASPADMEAHPDAVGRLAEGVEAQVVDRRGRALPPGDVGYIRFRAPHMPARYLGNPRASARAFRDGWFYPGDLAAMNDAGYVFFKGRDDDVINNQGAKFYPGEVEAVLLSHPAVAEAAVIGWPHPVTGEVAVAFVVKRGAESARELLDFCRERMAAHKVPWDIGIVDALPRNAAGKILKSALRARFRPGHER